MEEEHGFAVMALLGELPGCMKLLMTSRWSNYKGSLWLHALSYGNPPHHLPSTQWLFGELLLACFPADATLYMRLMTANKVKHIGTSIQMMTLPAVCKNICSFSAISGDGDGDAS